MYAPDAFIKCNEPHKLSNYLPTDNCNIDRILATIRTSDDERLPRLREAVGVTVVISPGVVRVRAVLVSGREVIR